MRKLTWFIWLGIVAFVFGLGWFADAEEEFCPDMGGPVPFSRLDSAVVPNFWNTPVYPPAHYELLAELLRDSLLLDSVRVAAKDCEWREDARRLALPQGIRIFSKILPSSAEGDSLTFKMYVRLDSALVIKTFADSRLHFYPKILRPTYISPEAARPESVWVRIGQEFLRERKILLERIRLTYGVEPEVIVAILKIETLFGADLGDHDLVSTLYSLYLVLPGRWRDFALRQLIFTFLLAQHGQFGPDSLFAIPSSNRGAFGYAQFLPESYFFWGTDGSGDGRVDLFNYDDACESIANYLRSHGWSAYHSSPEKLGTIMTYNNSRRYARSVLRYGQRLLIRS